MIDWTMPETITVGVVVVFTLGLIYRFLGQRTDPKLLELFKVQMEASSKRDEDSNAANERLAEALDRNIEILDTVRSGIELSFSAFAQSIREMVSSITLEHRTQLAAIGGIPAKIIPVIDTLTQQLADQKGSVDTMTDTVGDQNEAIQQILAAVLRLEARVETIATNFETLGTEIQETKNEIATIKGDVSKLQPIEKETPKPTDEIEKE